VRDVVDDEGKISSVRVNAEANVKDSIVLAWIQLTR
jgi:hypothetical protein